MNLLTGILSFSGWLIAVVILFRAWRRFHNRESKLAFIGFTLVFGSTALTLLVGAILSALAPSRSDIGVAFYLLGVPRLVGLVGTIVIVYVFWVVVLRVRTVHLSEREDEV